MKCKGERRKARGEEKSKGRGEKQREKRKAKEAEKSKGRGEKQRKKRKARGEEKSKGRREKQRKQRKARGRRAKIKRKKKETKSKRKEADKMREVICFHNPDEVNGYLSNWYLSDFEIGGIKFTSMEQYMMYQKACVFGDDKAARQILNTSDVGKIKALGRAVKNYEDVIWNGIRQIVVYEGLMEKFRQNNELKEKLLATGQSMLAECAVQDKIWGIGLSMKDEKRFDRKEWKGQNLLGFSIMKVRDSLRR